ncbi:hypothetical protein C8J57DRAFT_1094168 [Mycena rebaudengoi]|nr:hypothetical protein C8J57DRAFT_1094168 [Mycena rebaudengoi]
MCLLGTLPGSPSKDELNHAIQLVVDNLNELWDPGVFFTHTYNYPNGRHSRGMLVPLVSDALAARQTGGFTSVTSNLFCTMCALSMHQLEDFRKHKWPMRNHDDHLKHATEWRDASSETERDKLSALHGVRWTPLLDLPYWKVLVYLMADSMHILDLVLIPNHCRKLFGIDLNHDGGDGSGPRVPRPKRPSDERLIKIDDHHAAIPPPGNTGAVLGHDVMSAIWTDMSRTILPSWVGAAPSNWGTAKRGKLSANQWRTIFTIHIPITLIWIWRHETGRKKDLLDNMMELNAAIQSANMKRASPTQAAVYDQHIHRYVNGISELFKENNILPSHHVALHLGDLLRHGGPTHARSAPFFERFINHLQSQNTNMKLGM